MHLLLIVWGGVDWAKSAVCVGFAVAVPHLNTIFLHSRVHEESWDQLCLSVEKSDQDKTTPRWSNQMSSLRTGEDSREVFDWWLKRLHRQTAAVILIHHIHPVPPFVVRDCSQHLSQITLMHRKNLFFCSTPDGPFNSVWDWTRMNPLVMSCTLTNLPV